MSTTNRRGDIDGLRAVAVLCVILFHAGFSGTPGGFVGVDVFFVISGYLITLHMITEMQRGTFSIANFYARRARRILPALFLMMAVVLLFGWFLLLPAQFESTSEAAFATAFSVSNAYFWREAGYFASASEHLPLLHTWSLGVEEQFYIFLPIILILLFRARPSALRAVLVLSCILSFIISVWGAADRPSATFYLLPTRWWELATGSLLAAGVLPTVRQASAREAVAGIGLIAILSPVFLYSTQTTFPGASALLPCLGTAAVIHAGNSGSTAIARLLSVRPLTYIGLVSYSLYLWHWPIFVFARQMTVETHLSFATLVIAVLATFVAATVSWFFVEQPFQKSRATTPRVLSLSAISIAVMAVGCLMMMPYSESPLRLSGPVLLAARAADDYPVRAAACMDVTVSVASERCRIGLESEPIEFVLWGDSYAGALLPAVEKVAGSEAAGVFFGGGSCPPLGGAVVAGKTGPDRALCLRRNNAVADFIRNTPSVNTVYISAAWEKYPQPGNLVDEQGQPADFKDRFSTALKELQDEDISVFVIAGLPTPGFDVPWTLATSRMTGKALPPLPSTPDITSVTEVTSMFGIPVINLSDALCGDTCLVETEGRPVYVDGGHLTASAAAELIAPFLEATLNSSATAPITSSQR